MQKRPSYNVNPALPPLERSAHLTAADGWRESITSAAGQFSHDAALNKALTVHGSLVGALDALETVRQTRNPEHTPAQHLGEVQRQARKLSEVYIKRAQEALNELDQRITRADSEIAERIGVGRADPADGGEIRAILRSLEPEQRHRAILDAIEQADTATLAAVWHGRPLTVGLEPSAMEGLKQRASATHAPDLLQFKQSLQKARNLVDEASREVLLLSDKAAGNPDAQKQFADQVVQADMAMAELARRM